MSNPAHHAFPLRWPDGWARTPVRGFSRFKVDRNPAGIRDELLHGLKLMGATRVVLSTNVPLRRDGLPYSEGLGELHTDPGVAVYFERKGKAQVMACDTYRRPLENIRALSLAVEALRTLQRHGVTEVMERAFTGFAALPPPMAQRTWWDVLGVDRNAPMDTIKAAWRGGLDRFHPDRPGGDTEVAAQINRAYEEAQRERGAA